MKTIIADVGFDCANSDVVTIELEFSDEVLQSIKDIQEQIEKIPAMQCGIMEFDSCVLKKDDGEQSSFRNGANELKIFGHCVYFGCQSKYDSAYQIETHEILNKDLFD